MFGKTKRSDNAGVHTRNSPPERRKTRPPIISSKFLLLSSKRRVCQITNLLKMSPRGHSEARGSGVLSSKRATSGETHLQQPGSSIVLVFDGDKSLNPLSGLCQVKGVICSSLTWRVASYFAFRWGLAEWHSTTSSETPGAVRQPKVKSEDRTEPRGLLVPAYGYPRQFSLPDQPKSTRVRKLLPLRLQKRIKPAYDRSHILVRLYHRESLQVSRKSMFCPSVADVISAAMAFLGEYQLRKSAPGKNRNPGYVGLDLESSHGGFHIHYPDYCGSTSPGSGSITDDWEEVMRTHHHFAHNDVLLIGVCAGEAGACCFKG
ncbi:hypothetical protein GGR54DRAFT_590620 [Hypoxylon sp. NC1633]|nr:hypothetical protein GGR54DRAFT_590620 [Hypoxylon sp. NC1633]